MQSAHDRPGGIRALTLGGAALVLALSGCASTEPARVEYSSVEQALEQARQLNADRFAADELLEAESKLDRARELADDGEGTRATRLLAEARLHAELAGARAQRGEAQRSLAQINENLRALGAELQRE